MKGFEAALPQFEALGAQVVGISTDHHLALAAWQKDQGSKQLFLSDFRRQMLPAYGAMQTDEQSPVYRYAKRAYFIVDKTGTVVDTQMATVGPVAAKSRGTFKLNSTKGGVYGYRYKPLS